MGAFDKCKCGHVQGQHMDIAGCEVAGCGCLEFHLVDMAPPPETENEFRARHGLSVVESAELAEYAALKRVAQAARLVIKAFWDGIKEPSTLRDEVFTKIGGLQCRVEQLDALYPERKADGSGEVAP